MSFMADTLNKWMADLSPGGQLSRRVWCAVKYTPKGSTEEKDISEDLAKYLLSVDYNDNITEQVDDVTLTLEDRAQLWLGDWFPEVGSKLDITIYTLNKESLSEGRKEYHVGAFEIDEIEMNMPPSMVQIKAVSVISDSALRGVKKNRTWEKISIWKCADDIAKENGIACDWYCKENPNLDHVEQSDESDLEFLRKVTKDAGFCLKVTPEKIIIIDEEKQEEGEVKIVFIRPGTDAGEVTEKESSSENEKMTVNRFLTYRLTAKTRDIYKACHVKYKKGKEKKVIEATFTAPNKKDGKTLEVNEQVENVAEAERLAKKKLREQNKDEVTASFSLYGDFNFAAGVLVELKNFGKFDGKYIITKAGHKLGGGYTSDLELRKCLDGY